MAPDLSSVIQPRVLIVSRRTVRKNKFVNFVGEYHLDLIVSYGAAPVIVPRVSGVHHLLESFEPIHGVLLCEGEDIDPSHYDSGNLSSALSQHDLDEIRRLHPSDAAVDEEKDSIELALANLCLRRNIPYLGICRGSQILNVACGGTLYQDIGKELIPPSAAAAAVVHMDYDNYDGHRHPVSLVEKTPLHDWFRDSVQGPAMEISVNSYHHQGVKKLAPRFVPMAFSGDGLIEGFYDPENYNPEEGKFLMGLQFHPERMRNQETDQFDYPGCASAYQEFVKAVIAYEKRVSGSRKVAEVDGELEKKRMSIVRSFTMARNMYGAAARGNNANSEVLETGAEFLVANMALSMQQEMRVKQVGAAAAKMMEEKEKVARVIIGKMTAEQLSDTASYYRNMARICSEILETKLSSAA